MLWIRMCVDAGDLNAGRELPELRRRLTGVVPVSGAALRPANHGPGRSCQRRLDQSQAGRKLLCF